MTDHVQTICTLCGNVCDADTFAVKESDFYAGRWVVLIQGDSRYSGKVAKILYGKPPTYWPGLYDVEIDSTGERIRVRHDHMMMLDRIIDDAHYRELYLHRRRCDMFSLKGST